MVLKNSVKHKEVMAFGASEFTDALQTMGYDTSSKNPKTMLIASKKILVQVIMQV
jgi:hypothetical protein